MGHYYSSAKGYWSGTGPTYWTGNGPGQIGTGQKGGPGGSSCAAASATKSSAATPGEQWSGPQPTIFNFDFCALSNLADDPKTWSNYWPRHRIEQAITDSNRYIGRLASKHDEYLTQLYEACCAISRTGKVDAWALHAPAKSLASERQVIGEAADCAGRQKPQIEHCLTALRRNKVAVPYQTAWITQVEAQRECRSGPFYVDQNLDARGRAILDAWLAACPDGKRPTSSSGFPFYPCPERLELLRPNISPETLKRLGL